MCVNIEFISSQRIGGLIWYTSVKARY